MAEDGAGFPLRRAYRVYPINWVNRVHHFRFPSWATVWLLACFLLSPAARLHAAGRPMQVEDLLKMRRLGDIDLSPNGQWALFTVTDVDLERNSRTPHLWLIPLRGGEEEPLTASTAGESGGRFSPDGKQILFLSPRDGNLQIFLASFDSATGSIGPVRRLTHLAAGASGAMWAPDGAAILFHSSVIPGVGPGADPGVNPGADPRIATAAPPSSESEAAPTKARIFTHLLYRHWDRWTGDQRSHLFLVAARGGEPRDLTPDADQDIPPFSLGGPSGYAFSPDGKEIAFERNTDPAPALSTNSDIVTLDLTAPHATPVRISSSPGGDFTPRYSPDGKYIAFRSQARAGYESDRFRLMLYDRESKQTRELLPGFDRWVDDFVWSPDAKSIYFESGVSGEEPVFQVDISGGDLRRLTDLGEYGDLRPTPDGKSLVLSRSTVREPAEIFLLRLDQLHQPVEEPQPRYRHGESGPTYIAAATTLARQDALTHLNSNLLTQLDLPEMRSFWFNGAQHTRVEGFLLKPPGFDPARKYPVKFLIHGGPEGAWDDGWSYRWNPELFASNGYVVVMINPRGSTGYGQAFIDGVNGDWGGKPYVDLMLGLDHAEADFPFIDKSRECALGASYGGYMVDWILGHTNRFRCLVTHDGMFDTEAFYGATDELWFPEWEFKGTPWASGGTSGRSGSGDRSLYRRWSPMLSAANFKTPTLVIHSQLDYRLDVSQGFALFTTLQRMDVPSEMLYFPDEGHWVLQPQNSRLWNKTVSDWCDRYTGTNTAAGAGASGQTAPPAP